MGFPLKFSAIFLCDCRGASGAEYALLLAFIGASLAVATFVLGQSITDSIGNVSDLYERAGCDNNGQGTGLGGGNGGGAGQGAGHGSGNTC